MTTTDHPDHVIYAFAITAFTGVAIASYGYLFTAVVVVFLLALLIESMYLDEEMEADGGEES